MIGDHGTEGEQLKSTADSLGLLVKICSMSHTAAGRTLDGAVFDSVYINNEADNGRWI